MVVVVGVNDEVLMMAWAWWPVELLLMLMFRLRVKCWW